MDRCYKRADLVHVYQSTRQGELLDTFRDKPYSYAGFDNYRYKGAMYPGFEHQGKVYILLDSPIRR